MSAYAGWPWWSPAVAWMEPRMPTPDPVICLRVAGKSYLAVSSLEYGRAEKEAPVDRLLSYDELGIMRLARELKSGAKAYAAAVANLLAGAPWILSRMMDAGAGTVTAVSYEYGNCFLIVAGLLNFLVILDAYDIALGRK